MERALRGAAPDVVRSALPSRKIPDSIDQLLAAPQKIVIPERYIPEKVSIYLPRIIVILSIIDIHFSIIDITIINRKGIVVLIT